MKGKLSYLAHGQETFVWVEAGIFLIKKLETIALPLME